MEEKVFHKVALYCRVSTEEAKHGQSTEMQRKALEEFAWDKGWKIVDCIEAHESTRKRRPEFEKLIDRAKKGRYDCILVWKMDRFARSLLHFVQIVPQLHALDVAFISIKDRLDFATAASRLHFHILAAFAEFERDQTRERVIAGLEHAKKFGTKSGRPIGRKQEVNAEKIQKLHAEGLSIRGIAKQLKCSHTTVARHVKGKRSE